MNVKQLKDLIANLPDDAPVLMLDEDGETPFSVWTAGADDMALEGLDSDGPALIVSPVQ